jgi:DNA-binding transcriptional MerR regulator
MRNVGEADASATAHDGAVGLTIGQLAERTGCTAEAIRYYEREGVVPRPARAGSGRYRRYGAADVERIAFLRRARDLGFSLAEVRELLAFNDGDPAHSCHDVDQMARAHLAQVDAKIAQLTALRDALAGVIDQCRGGLAVADCRILGALGGQGREEPEATTLL